ncbi:MAG: hypothetical protein FJ241_12895, partial [Nitrospira sp.]|nr:hypothetical protein [Nitrospira sp.]
MQKLIRFNNTKIINKLFFTVKQYHNFLSDLGIIIAGKIIGRGFDFLFGVILARKLGPEQFGIFTVLNTLLLFSGDILRFGLNNSFLKMVSDYKREGAHEK